MTDLGLSGMQWQIFCLGTNNWQSTTEFAPGSGILHEGHHHSLAALPEVAGRCFSIWPSPKQKSDPARGDYRVFELKHDIPICESVGPVSSYRWHRMSEEEVTAYRTRLVDECEAYVNSVEADTGRPFNLFIAHHTFQNPAALIELNARRKKQDKVAVPIVVFAHGTALKMYQNEVAKLDEFPMRFYSWVNSLGVFRGSEHVKGVFAIAKAQKETFMKLFPDYPADRVRVVSNGYNQRIFKPIAGATPANVLAQFEPLFPEGFDLSTIDPAVRKSMGFTGDDILTLPSAVPAHDKVVVFTGRFADWKRIDVVLKAAKIWEAERSDLATVIIGAGALPERTKYAKMAHVELGLHHTFVLGPQAQDRIALINTVASVGVYPSKDEPFGLVFVECMACGTPAIGARSGGPLDFVHDDVGALVEESDDHEVLAQRLAGTVAKALSEDWKAKMGKRCIEYATKGFSLTAQCAGMLCDVKAML